MYVFTFSTCHVEVRIRGSELETALSVVHFGSLVCQVETAAKTDKCRRTVPGFRRPF